MKLEHDENAEVEESETTDMTNTEVSLLVYVENKNILNTHILYVQI